VPRPARDDDGPLWLTVTAFGRQTQACARYLKAGQQVAVSGRRQPDRWTRKDATTRDSVQIVAHHVEVLFAAPPVREDRDPEEPAARTDRARQQRASGPRQPSRITPAGSRAPRSRSCHPYPAKSLRASGAVIRKTLAIHLRVPC
jgi:single-stranded DNA-binding protein